MHPTTRRVARSVFGDSGGASVGIGSSVYHCSVRQGDVMASAIGIKELFEFDLNGYVVVKGFLSQEEVARMNGALDAQPSARQAHKFKFILTDPMFMDLMSDRRILDICSEWIDPHFRFDHAWGVQHYPDEANPAERENLHGGPYAEQSYFQYHWRNDRPTCTCIICAYVLEAQLPGDGGFVIVPGSHKSNLGLLGTQVFNLILGRDHAKAPWVVQPELHPGDLLIFTEAAMHGTEAWRAPDRRRRNLYYKYGYGAMGWPPQDNEEALELRRRARNTQEELLLRPPYVSTLSGNQLKWREPTVEREVPPAGHVTLPGLVQRSGSRGGGADRGTQRDDAATSDTLTARVERPAAGPSARRCVQCELLIPISGCPYGLRCDEEAAANQCHHGGPSWSA
jgi:hypothetical protein